MAKDRFPSGRRRSRPLLQVLVVDVGGTSIKVLATGEHRPRKIPSGPKMTAREMVEGVKRLAKDWTYEVVSLGYPGPVLNDRPTAEPRNLGKGWVGFDFEKAFGRPVKVINDAAMQALGSYEAGRMLFLGLGTGLGSALITDGVLVPLEVAHLLYGKGRTYEDNVGLRGLREYGKKKWRRYVAEVVGALRQALQADHVVLGGGNAKKLKRLPDAARRGHNNHAFIGGFRLWEEAWKDERPTCIVRHEDKGKGDGERAGAAGPWGGRPGSPDQGGSGARVSGDPGRAAPALPGPPGALPAREQGLRGPGRRVSPRP